MNPPNPLDLTPEAFRLQSRAVTDRLAQWLADLPSAPADGTLDGVGCLPPEILRITEEGLSADQVLDSVMSRVVPAAFETAGPGYMAYVPGGGLPTAALAGLVAMITNRYVGVAAATPLGVDLEVEVLRWLAAEMGLSPDAAGVLTTGGSLSNLMAVCAARDQADQPIAQLTAYVGAEVHHAMTKALRLAGVSPSSIRILPSDSGFRLPAAAVSEAMRADAARGLTPFFVCGSAGTVNTGAVDDLAALADVAQAHGAWFHVDAAYGGGFRLVPELRPVLAGMERADSIALDPHKGLFLPYGMGALLVKNPEALRRAHGDTAPYLPLDDSDHRPNFCDLSPELSRDWRGLRLWWPLRQHGARAFRDALREKHALAVRAAESLSQQPFVELAHPPALSLFAFRRRYPGLGPEEANRRNRLLQHRICASQRVKVTGTTLNGAYWIRICVLHFRTDAARVEEALDIIRGALSEA